MQISHRPTKARDAYKPHGAKAGLAAAAVVGHNAAYDHQVARQKEAMT
jgi:hypothetical protein